MHKYTCPQYMRQIREHTLSEREVWVVQNNNMPSQKAPKCCLNNITDLCIFVYFQ